MAWRGRPVALKLTTVKDFRDYMKALRFSDWKPSGMTLHNTATPNRERWNDYPGEQWLRNLKSFYINKGWAAGPHAFLDGNHIWIMTDFNTRGVHSPSWNGTRLGIEMVADFAKEDDETGIGLKVKQQAAAVFAVCHEVFGWEPSMNSIKLHKEDPATDHDCPGRKIDKAEFVRMVTEAMGDGGDPVHDDASVPITPKEAHVSVALDDRLNIRDTPSAGALIVATLPNNTPVTVIGQEINGTTKWYRVSFPVSAPQPGGLNDKEGWAAAAYIVLGVLVAKTVNKDITATVFGGAGDPQNSAYTGKKIDGTKPAASLPYKWRNGPPPKIRVTGPKGSVVVPIVDLGPWNLDNPEYVLNGARPLAEKQFKAHSRAQNGMVPTNDAGIDLTPGAAKIVGVTGKGKVSWEFA